MHLTAILSSCRASRNMTKYVYGMCWTSLLATVLGAVLERDIMEWTGVIIAAGASVFAFGLGRYHDFRRERREEDHQDRLNMLEDIRAHTRILCEMETRQEALQKSMTALTLDLKRIRCAFPDHDNSPNSQSEQTPG